jgi:hypothetical protein
MNIETNRADPNLPYFSATQDPLNKDHSDHGHNGDSDSNINEPDNNEVLEQSFHFIFKLDQFPTYPIFIPCLTDIIPVYSRYMYDTHR